MEIIFYFTNNKRQKMIINMRNKKYFNKNKNNNQNQSINKLKICLNNFQNLVFIKIDNKL